MKNNYGNDKDNEMLNKYTDDAFVKELRNVYPGKDVEIIAGVDDGEMYEWDVAYVYRVYEVDNYYVGEGSGCSCNWYEDSAGYGDLMQFSSRRAVLSYLRNNKSSKLKSLHSEVLRNK